jgi:hypothetical protein
MKHNQYRVSGIMEPLWDSRRLRKTHRVEDPMTIVLSAKTASRNEQPA